MKSKYIYIRVKGMMTNTFKQLGAVAILLMAGCSSEVQVNVEGFGSVSTADGEFNCWAGNDCSNEFEKSVTLVARDPSDGSATFSEWSGACTGTERECTLNRGGRVQAHFLPTESLILNPVKPVFQSVTGLSPTRISILWQAASDEKRAQDSLSYLLYVSADKESLLSKSNLVSTIAGNMFGEYAFEYDVAEPTDLTLQPATVHVAIAVRDEKGAVGEPALMYDIRLQQAAADTGFDVVSHKAPVSSTEGDGEI